MFETLRRKLAQIVRENELGSEEVTIRAFPLSPKEAIGTPEERDYPLIKGRERLMQAEFKGAKGQAYTDMYGDFSGKLTEVLEMELGDNFRRAVFISTLNAVMRHLGLVSKTIHCKDQEPRRCAEELVRYLQEKYCEPKVALVGFQPRMAEALSQRFKLRITDLDEQNIGQERFGVRICGPEKTQENLKWCDLALVTGTTLVNGTLPQFLDLPKPVVLYGVTIAGAAKLLGLERFCPLSH
ncbi:MAG: hypothetical protein DRI26_04435 [Chloroflexi bacterium]|nr:MAG: hypothetical protein DRI26_04435 [Chloroflexota bacterium]